MKRLVAFWSSLTCTVSLLLGLTALCILGTLIPQQPLMVPHGSGWTAWMLARLSPYDLFHSLWLAGISTLLCLNIMLCMRSRLRPGRQGSSPRRWAVIGLHASILLIFAGMLAGTFGLDARLELREGQQASQVQGPDGSMIPLDFSVLCEDFDVELYPGGMPKEYISRLVFSKQGSAALKGELKVNHPLAYEGLRFYQESYESVPEASLQFSRAQFTQSLRVHEGEIVSLDEDHLKIQVIKITGNLMNMGPAVKLVYAHSGASGHLWIFRDIARIKEAIPDIFQRAPGFNPELVAPYAFGLSAVRERYTTGIGVKRDPGAPLVAAGAAFFLLCLIMALLLPGQPQRLRACKGNDPGRMYPCQNPDEKPEERPRDSAPLSE